MAKQVGPVLFTGTIDGLIFYKLGDQYYTRSKGSYKSAKHMRRNPKYKRTMEKADQFGRASHLAQELYYRHVPKAARKHGLFGQLTGLVNRLLQEGIDIEEVKKIVVAHCQSLPPAKATQPTTTNQQSTTLPSPASPVTEQRSTITHQPLTPRPKQARYLSKWNIKQNGKLHIPSPLIAAHSLLSAPFPGQAQGASTSIQRLNNYISKIDNNLSPG